MSRNVLEDFGSPSRGGSSGPFPDASPDRFDDGYNAGWDDAMAQAAKEGTRLSTSLTERLETLRRDQRAATASALGALEPALRDIFDRLLPRAAERAFLPVLMEEIGHVLDAGVRSMSLAVSPEDAPALTRLLSRADIPAGTVCVRAEPAMSIGQAVIGWTGQERRVDLEGTLAALDAALETFLATMDRGADVAGAEPKEAVNG